MEILVSYKNKKFSVSDYIKIISSVNITNSIVEVIPRSYIFSDFDENHKLIPPSTYENGITPIINAQKEQLQLNGWWPFFEKFMNDKQKMSKLDNGLISEYKICPDIYPPPNQLFNTLLLTSLNNAKILLIGQNPYHTPDAAMGLAFSHTTGYKKIQPSLANIYKELKSCGYKINEKSGDLTKWAKEGVLLLNTALTVRKGDPNSQINIWKDFSGSLFKYISENCNHIVVIMWGNHAQNYAKIFNTKQHEHLKSVHPSPMSVNNGFFGTKHFVLANNKLKEWGLEEVDWNLV